MEKIEKIFISEKSVFIIICIYYIAFILNLFHLKIRGRDGLIIYLKIDGICMYNM